MSTFTCRKCGTEKPIEEFPVDRRDSRGHRSACKACMRKYRNEYRRKNGRSDRGTSGRRLVDKKRERELTAALRLW